MNQMFSAISATNTLYTIA